MVDLVYRAACRLAMTDKPQAVDYFGVFVFAYCLLVLAAMIVAPLAVVAYNRVTR